MYGMLLESIQHYVQETYGMESWQQILEHAGMKNMIFSTHKVYKDEIMVNLATSCSTVLQDRNIDEYMYYFGQCFVDFCRHYGYDKVLRVAGRHYRDFLNGIDNLHETIRFSYPKLQSPSFIVEMEDRGGCVLTYRSKRVGFAYYVMGQLTQCARRLYNVDVDIHILQEIRTDHGCHVKYRLDFPNMGYYPPITAYATSGTLGYPRIASSTFFKLFPFCLVFDSSMLIRYMGPNLTSIFQNRTLIGCKISEKFGLRRPLVDFTWENIMCLQKVIFEVESEQQLRKSDQYKRLTALSENGQKSSLLLRGQMKYMKDWTCMAFLCTPLIGNLEDMETTGLYVNDLNMFDNSQDMVLAGWHHASQLEYLVDRQMETSHKIAQNLQQLDEWRHKSNALLYSMMPESIAVRLKLGEDPIKTCETFEKVTIMFSYLIGFSDICANASAFQVVECINNVFTVFDNIVDRYRAFKVETLGDAVYMVAGGVPDRRADHTQHVAGLALEFVDNAKYLKDPLSGNSLTVRIGMHVGGVVAGIVGKRTPQYCLFGDTVNTASRMQSYSQPGRIHVSQTCHENLQGSEFVTIFRGQVNVKGKGEQKTYWLAGRRGSPSTSNMILLIQQEQNLKTPRIGSVQSCCDLHNLHISSSGTNLAATFNQITCSQDELDSNCNEEQGSKVKLGLSNSLSDIRFIDEDDDPEEQCISAKKLPPTSKSASPLTPVGAANHTINAQQDHKPRQNRPCHEKTDHYNGSANGKILMACPKAGMCFCESETQDMTASCSCALQGACSCPVQPSKGQGLSRK
ncbi:soluble guanylate cyclase 89Db-like [Haliotis cracherodii]|uniref:soluble guanylate cyclase 89Db-like n=1 Tax=Haliotis cracherodii TaxID=6455 RepID=UPI0039EBA4A3